MTAPLRRFVLAILCAAGLFLGVDLPSEGRPRVAVLPFKNPPGFDFPIGEGLAQIFRKRLMDTGKIQIVVREDLNEMRDELKLAEDGFFEASTFPAKGGFQGADYIIVGRVLDFGHYSRDTSIGALNKMFEGLSYTKTTAYVRIGIEVVDLTTGRLTMADEAEGKHQKSGAILLAGDLKRIFIGGIKIGSSEFENSMIGRATKTAMDRLMSRLAGVFSKEAKVLAISPDGFVIDMGLTSGVKNGQKGRLFATREIKNAAGKTVWKSRKQVGDAEIVDVQTEESLMKSSAIGEIREGDIVIFDAP